MRLIAFAFTLAQLTAPIAAQTAQLRDVVARLDQYLESYEAQLANVVAEETYRQWVEEGSKASRRTLERTLHSDFALTLTPDGTRRVGYRDTFEMDGVAVRGREERLQQLLASGAVGQAERIADQNARFNLGEWLITRNINVPTFALEMMNARYRDRFKVRRRGVDTIGGRSGWLLEFREQNELTFVRTPEGHDQPSRVVALVDVQTGEVIRTVLTWEKLKGSITVLYGHAPGIPVPVPIRMAESYVARNGAIVGGEASYANFRQFETSVRIIR